MDLGRLLASRQGGIGARSRFTCSRFIGVGVGPSLPIYGPGSNLVPCQKPTLGQRRCRNLFVTVLMKQPLGIVALLYLCGLLLGCFFQPPLSCLLPATVALVLAALLLRRFRLLLIRALIVLIAWTNLIWHSAIISPTDLRTILADKPELATVRGTLAATPVERVYIEDSGQYVRTTARINATAVQRGTNWIPATGEVSVGMPGELPEAYFKGQQVEIYGVRRQHLLEDTHLD